MLLEAFGNLTMKSMDFDHICNYCGIVGSFWMKTMVKVVQMFKNEKNTNQK
jgi:hypothetical protein